MDERDSDTTQRRVKQKPTNEGREPLQHEKDAGTVTTVHVGLHVNAERNMQVHIAPSGYANHVALLGQEKKITVDSTTEGSSPAQRERKQTKGNDRS